MPDNSEYTFFTIPFNSVPQNPPYQTWFADWTDQRPELKTNEPRPFVVGATRNGVPQGATVLATGFKNSLDKPPLPPSPSANFSDYQECVKRWLCASEGTQPCTYFAIPYTYVQVPYSYTAWFATWSETRPDVGPDMLPPLVIGLTMSSLPNEATGLATGGGGKDPPPPPPAAPGPAVDLSDYRAWLSNDLDVRWG